jgi:hypothetical protein
VMVPCAAALPANVGKAPMSRRAERITAELFEIRTNDRRI